MLSIIAAVLAALSLLSALAVAWPWIRLPRVDAEARATITECAVVVFTGASFFAVAVAGGLI